MLRKACTHCLARVLARRKRQLRYARQHEKVRVDLGPRSYESMVARSVAMREKAMSSAASRARKFMTSTSASCTARLDAAHGTPPDSSADALIPSSAHASLTVSNDAFGAPIAMRSAI